MRKYHCKLCSKICETKFYERRRRLIQTLFVKESNPLISCNFWTIFSFLVSLCVCSIYCVNKSLYGSSKLTNPPPITATFDVVSGLLDSILVYFLKKRKKFLCRTSELGYTLQVSQVSRQLQKSGCDVTSYKTRLEFMWFWSLAVTFWL